MRVVVPLDIVAPKTRLSPVFSPAERRAFVAASLADVLDAVAAAGGEPELLATAPLAAATATDEPAPGDDDPALPTDPARVVADRGVPVAVDERPLTDAVNAVLAGAGSAPDAPIAVLVADLALATGAAVRRLFEPDDDPAAVALAPGLGGGTNGLVVRDPAFRVDYHDASVRDHRARARDLSGGLREVDSRRLAVDVDEPADLAEVVLDGDGAAAAWLERAGVALAVDDGRVGVEREG